MSKIDQLINRLCPDGVEYRTLGSLEDAGLITLGRGKVISKKDIQKNPGDYPIYSSSATNNGLLGTYGDYMFEEELITWSIDGGGKFFYRPSSRYSVTNVCGWLRVNDGRINTKYLYHALLNEWQKKVFDYVHKAHPSTIRKEYVIPLPPLEVQNEIVRILDNFMDLTTELTEELTSRKKQYEYYRDAIMKNVDADEACLGDVCRFIRGPFGGSLKKECFKETGYAVYEQQHAIYANLDFRYYVDKDKFLELKRFEVCPGDLIVSCSGTIGRVFIIPQNAPKGIINQALLKLTPSERIDGKYLKYFFENSITSTLNSVARGGAIQNVPSVNELKRIKIAIPSIEEQRRVVEMLDNFSILNESISCGLPAEIIARQKQYEFYRDDLLAFRELKTA